MPRIERVLLLAGAAFLAVACGSGPPAPAAGAAPAFRVDFSIREVMASMISPGATALWDAVAVTVGAGGEQDEIPKSDEEWAEVGRQGIMMTEATNLLLIPGRHVAPSGATSANPGAELEPAEIETLVNDHWQEWVSFANALHDVGLEALETVDARDPEALTLVGGDIDAACENCHQRFWYPDQQ